MLHRSTLVLLAITLSALLTSSAPIPAPDSLDSSPRDTTIVIPVVGHSFIANEGYADGGEEKSVSATTKPVVGNSFIANEGYVVDSGGDIVSLPGLKGSSKSSQSGKKVPHVGFSFVANEGYGSSNEIKEETPIVGNSFVANEGYE